MLRKNLILFSCSVFALCYASFRYLTKESRAQALCWSTRRANCGEDWEDSPLPVLRLPELPLRNRSIYFIEGFKGEYLPPRMLCAIESAALTHPNVNVYALMTSPILRVTPTTKRVLDNYDNVKIHFLNSTKLYLNSPLKEWFLKKTWRESPWPEMNFSDPIRLMLLWHYGGVYLDMDVVVIKYLMHQPNFVGLESPKWVNTGVMGFTERHPLLDNCIMKIRNSFNGSVWGSNGPKLITTMLVERCGMELPSGKLKFCPDIKVYQPNAFYPVPWWDWNRYLKDDKLLSENLLKNVEVLAIHLWNHHTQNYPVILEESSPYAVAAKKFCPIVADEVGNIF